MIIWIVALTPNDYLLAFCELLTLGQTTHSWFANLRQSQWFILVVNKWLFQEEIF